MLSQPDILHKMNNQVNSNLPQEELNSKHKMKISVDYQDLKNNQTCNETKVKLLLESIRNEENIKIINDTILNDFKKQNTTFKERLLQRKKKVASKNKSKLNSRNQSRVTSKDFNAEDIDKSQFKNNLSKALNFDLIENYGRFSQNECGNINYKNENEVFSSHQILFSENFENNNIFESEVINEKNKVQIIDDVISEKSDENENENENNDNDNDNDEEQEVKVCY